MATPTPQGPATPDDIIVGWAIDHLESDPAHLGALLRSHCVSIDRLSAVLASRGQQATVGRLHALAATPPDTCWRHLAAGMRQAPRPPAAESRARRPNRGGGPGEEA